MFSLNDASKRFVDSEDGAVTVDWVVLTALVMGLTFPLAANYYGMFTSATAVVATNIHNVGTSLCANVCP